MAAYIPSLDELRHEIDMMAPILPDRMSRTEVATLMFAMQLQGMSIAIDVLRTTPISPEAMDIAVRKLLSLSEQLVDSLSDE
jgi:hypothetical protein